MCAHAGQAQPVLPFARVTVSGMPITTVASQYMITGCPSYRLAAMAHASPLNGSCLRCALWREDSRCCFKPASHCARLQPLRSTFS